MCVRAKPHGKSKTQAGEQMMICQKCKKAATKVINSRKRADGHIYRRRECVECGARFTTVELYTSELPGIQDTDKRRERREYCNKTACFECELERCWLDELEEVQ